MMTGAFRTLVTFYGALLFVPTTLRSQPHLPTPSAIESKKPITVDSAIELTRLADPSYFSSSNSTGRVAQFSPDGNRFVIVLRRGIVAENVNEYSIHLFTTKTVFSTRPGRVVLTMKSSSNRPAIKQWKWLGDSRTLLFIGETPGHVSQIYAFDTVSKQLTELTHHPTAITCFTTSKDGKQIVFFAEPRRSEHSPGPINISDQRLDNLLMGKRKSNPDRLELFTLARGGSPFRIATPIDWYEDTLSMSSDGRYAVVAAQVKVGDLPSEWSKYEYPGYYKAEIATYFHSKNKDTPTAFTRYFVLDTLNRTISPIWGGPTIGFAPLAWSAVGHSLFLKGTYLPINRENGPNRKERVRTSYDVEISIPRGEWRVIADHDWPTEEVVDQLCVRLQEDINTPPEIFVETTDGRKNKLLLDLNPQLRKLALGKVETVTWMVHGIEVNGGLYYPPDYVPGRKYPLVIQTHGYVPTQFSMDGRSEWSSSFAARPLAAQGMLVLQVFSFKNTADHDFVATDRSLGMTAQQSYAIFDSLSYDAAIDELAKRGMVDETRIGISGFSRTVWFVAYTLTHSTHGYRAAIQTDGIDGGYFQYIAFKADELVLDNGGLPPFGADGLARWLKESPGFNLDKVGTPIRLVALDLPGILEAWEWFAGLQLQGKPVDFVALPDGTHLLERASDRKIAMQGVVDWFGFWLQGYKRPNPEDPDQYKRWEHLRELRDAGRVSD